MIVCFQYRIYKDKNIEMPVVIINDSSFKKPYSITIQGFPVPETVPEAISYACQSINRFFEQYLDNKELPNGGIFPEEIVEYRREARAILNQLVNKDLSNLKLIKLKSQIINLKS